MIFLAFFLNFYFIFVLINRRLGSTEFFLIAPWVAGSNLLWVAGFGFHAISESSFILAALIGVEFFLLYLLVPKLLPVDVVRDGDRNDYKHLLALKIYAAVFLPVILIYLSTIFADIASASSVSEYFLNKRALAHSGEGVDKSNQIIYRLINSGLPLLVLFYILSKRMLITLLVKIFIGFFFFALCVASLMEGNRSTLIVSVVAFFVVYFNSVNVSYSRLSFFFLGFVAFFAFSMALFRFDEEFSFFSFVKGVEYFFLYSFGSLLGFDAFYEKGISIYWGSYDSLIRRISSDGAETFGARELFFIDYTSVFFGIDTNVYSSYSVLMDYLGPWMFLFLALKALTYRFFLKVQRYGSLFSMFAYLLVGCLSLGIYHDFFITGLYLVFSVLLIYSPFYIISSLYLKFKSY